MNTISISMQAILPLAIAIGLTILAGVTALGSQRQKVKVKAKKRS